MNLFSYLLRRASTAGAVLVFLSLGSPTVAAEDLQIVVKSTIGERSKDSSSVTTTITVKDTKLAWEQSGSTARGRGETLPRRKDFNLSASEKSELLKLIKTNNILVMDSLQFPQQPPVFYFDVSLDLAVGSERGTIRLSAPRSANQAGKHPLYRKSMILLTKLYRIIGAQDESIRFEEPLQQRR